MTTPRKSWLIAGSLVLSASLAVGTALQGPTTWVVDDDGGPGIDFTDLQAAINTASAGDLILVKPGSYGDFDLGKPLTILGEEGVFTSVGTIHDVDDMAILAELAFEDLELRDCSGTVVLDELAGWQAKSKWSYHPEVLIERCDDVRLIGLDSNEPQYGIWSGAVPSIIARASRVEVTSSLLRGQAGNPKTPNTAYWGDPGLPALVVEEGSRVHLTRTSAKGGFGGYSSYNVNGYGGDGGEGIDIVDGTVIATGRGAEVIHGGRGHGIQLYGYAGYGGHGVRVSPTSSFRHSNVQLAGGGAGGWNASGGFPLIVQPGGTAKQPKNADPVLERVEAPTAGQTFDLKLRGKPGTYARMFWGFTPQVKPAVNVVVENLVVKEVTLPVGYLPSSGVMTIPFTPPPDLTLGSTIFLQAMVIYPSGAIRRTNSVPVVVR